MFSIAPAEHVAVLAGARRGRVQVRRGQLSVRERRLGRRAQVEQNRLLGHGLRFAGAHQHARSVGDVRHGARMETLVGQLPDQRTENQVIERAGIGFRRTRNACYV